MKHLIALFFVLFSTSSFAQWYGSSYEVDLGTVRVADFARSQYLPVNSCDYTRNGNGRIAGIRLTAERDAVDIQSVRVRFENGRTQELFGARGYLYPGQSTRTLDFNGMGRCIDSIEVVASDNDFGDIGRPGRGGGTVCRRTRWGTDCRPAPGPVGPGRRRDIPGFLRITGVVAR